MKIDHKWALLTCFLSLVVMVSSSDGKFPFKTSAKDAPQPCCIEAEQFVIEKEETTGLVHGGIIGRLLGQESVQEIHRTAVDYTNNVLGSFIRKWYPSGKVVDIHVIEYLNKGYLWMLYPYEGKCQKVRVPRGGFHFQRCIPATAKYLESYYISDTNEKADKWLIEDSAVDTYQLSVSENCVPVSETFIGEHAGQQMASSSIYYNFTLGIPDDGEPFFDVPLYCNEAEEESTKLKFAAPEEEEEEWQIGGLW